MEQELSKLRKLADAIVGCKRGPSVDTSQLRQLTTDGLLNILAVKDANKRLCSSTEGCKEETNKVKQSLDTEDSQLQNLLYEKGYYQKEIQTCRSFISKIKDADVALMPVEEFFASLKDAPEEQALKQQATVNDHEQMKARLIHENHVRKTLVKQLGELKSTSHTLAETVAVQKKTLSDLQTQLRHLEGTAKPLQSVLAPTPPLRFSRTADLLPTPLYVAYSQLTAAKEALQIGCSVAITGNVDDAESYARSAVAPDQLADSVNNKQGEDVYKVHPLSLEIQVHKQAATQGTTAAATASTTTSSTQSKSSSSNPVVMTVILQYLPSLKVVTAHTISQGDNVLLKALFPGDDGGVLPLEAVQQLQGGSFRYSSSKVERPYRWCQHLCGLDFVPTLPTLACHLAPDQQEAVFGGLDGYRRQQRVVSVVHRLRAVKQAEGSLNAQLSGFTRNFVPADMTMFGGQTPKSLVVAFEQQQSASNANHSSMVPASPLPPRTRSTALTSKHASGNAKDAAGDAARISGGSASQLARLSEGGGKERTPAPGSTGAVDDDTQQVKAGVSRDGVTDLGPAGPGSAAPSHAGTPAPDVAAGDMDATMEDGEMGVDEEFQDEEFLEDGEADGNADMQYDNADLAGGNTRDERDRSKHLQRDAAAALKLLFGDDDDNRQSMAGTDNTDTRSRRAKPISHLHRIVVRSRALEIEASVRVYPEYPVRPAMFRVKFLKPLPATAGSAFESMATATSNTSRTQALKTFQTAPAGEALGDMAANQVAWLEQQVNVVAPSLVPQSYFQQTILYQVTQLRLCLDNLTQQFAANGWVAANATALPGLSGGPAVPTAQEAAALMERQKLSGRERNPPGPAHALNRD